MPRVSKAEKEENRRRIVAAASRMFRAQGIDQVGIADLMNAAGLTHGGFYNHFASKEALAVAVCKDAFAASLTLLDEQLADGESPGGGLPQVVEGYLSPTHRDADDGGCPSASLVIDAWRQSNAIQSEYASGIEGYLTAFTDELQHSADEADTPEAARTHAIRLFSEMIGAMTLARAVHQVRPDLSDEILTAVQQPNANRLLRH